MQILKDAKADTTQPAIADDCGCEMESDDEEEEDEEEEEEEQEVSILSIYLS